MSDEEEEDDYYTICIEDDDVYGDLVALKSPRVNGIHGSRPLPVMPVNHNFYILSVTATYY